MSDLSYELKTSETESGQVYAAGFESLSMGLGLPENFGKEVRLEAERIERRLQRIEKVLGLGPID